MNSLSAQAIKLMGNAAGFRPPFGTTAAIWEQFEEALTLWHGGQHRSFVERREGYGCFGILPSRLVDLGIATDVRRVNGKPVSAVFKATRDYPSPKLAEHAWLSSPERQRKALIVSLAQYDKLIEALLLPHEMTRSGGLALHHRLGPHALEKWTEYKKPSTLEVYERANGLF